MAYNSYPEEDLAQELPNDPHAILNEIGNLNQSIERQQSLRRKLYERYQMVMKDIESHYHTVNESSNPEAVKMTDYSGVKNGD